VHANSIDAIQYGALAARLMRTPLVGHIRNVVTFRRHGIWLVKQADRLIAVSEAVRRSLIDQGVSAARVEVIHNGIAVDQFQAASLDQETSRREFNVPTGVPLVGSVGRLHPIKGYDDFLQAARLVLNDIPATHFIIAGAELESNSSYRDELIELAHQLGIAERIHFAGEVNQVAILLHGLDAFVLSSRQEPFARAILEAMSCACPIVATAVDGTPEAVEDGRSALLVPPAQPASLAAAITRLLVDRELASRLGHAAQERVASLFTIAANVERTVSLYERLLEA
jgi:glycosyltransferase involved in cell wall biosynthesis